MELWNKEQIWSLLPALAGMLLLSFVLRKVLEDRPEKVRRIPLQIIAVLLLLLEVGKQGVSIWRGYDLYHLPFHFCSLFLLTVPVMAFYNGKHKVAVEGVTTSLCASLFLLMLVYPALIYSGTDVVRYFDDYMSFHTVTFHNLVMLAFLLILALRMYTPSAKGELKPTLWFTVVFCVVSASMAHLLRTNFANYYQCNIAPLEAVRVSLQGVLGTVVTQLLYVAIVSVLNILFVMMSYWVSRTLLRLLTPKREKEKV
ncbi:MAG: YwaF family protein [Oscillospiraceae bacterium]|nr:YwaF family protein [Oscillospiraceae bacterium]